MTILAIATSGPQGEVGLRLADGTLWTAPLISGRTRGRDLLPAVARLLNERGVEPHALTALAVDVGPGSFTGVRVGVTTAKTLAFALALPVVAVNSLDVLAEAAPPEHAVLALRDAGRGRAYFACFAPHDGTGRARRAGPARGTAAEILAVQGDALPVGEEAEGLARALGLHGTPRRVRAGVAALLAAALPRLDEGARVPAHALAPLYLQASAPERLRDGEPPGPAPSALDSDDSATDLRE